MSGRGGCGRTIDEASRYADGGADLATFDPDALEHYLAALRDPVAVHASCEGYRAAASIDIVHDDADGDARLGCPLRVLWGAEGIVGTCLLDFLPSRHARSPTSS